jgi:hypothetical protein
MPTKEREHVLTERCGAPHRLLCRKTARATRGALRRQDLADIAMLKGGRRRGICGVQGAPRLRLDPDYGHSLLPPV